VRARAGPDPQRFTDEPDDRGTAPSAQEASGMQETPTVQRVVGDAEHEHVHPAVIHTHDHYHVSHHHTGGMLGEFEHRSHYHSHEHNHAPIDHAHEDRSEDEERQEHDGMAHTHDHGSPIDGST